MGKNKVKKAKKDKKNKKSKKSKVKYIVIFTMLSGCSTAKKHTIEDVLNYSFKDELNKSIIDGFYDSDTTGIGKDIYLLK